MLRLSLDSVRSFFRPHTFIAMVLPSCLSVLSRDPGFSIPHSIHLGPTHLPDFGLSNELGNGKTALDTWCGSLAYSAPELIGQKPYGKEVDIWGMYVTAAFF